jgi:ligand-binding sensor domain-containing protein/signal transduction histidine kinase
MLQSIKVKLYLFTFIFFNKSDPFNSLPFLKRKKHTLIPLLFKAIVFLYSFSSISQPYFFRHYQVENGLSNNTVYCTIQDKNGFLWFGTKDGLNRFDGFHFKTFKVSDDEQSLRPDLINCLLNDRKGKLWIGSTKGLYFFDPLKEHLISFADSLGNVSNLQFDRQGQLWFLSNSMICRYNFFTKTMKTFPTQKYFNASAICADFEGKILTSSDKGILQLYDEKNNTFKGFDLFSHSPKVPSNFIEKMYCSDRNTIFIGTTSQGLKKFDVKTCTYVDVLTFNQDRTRVHVRDIIRYSATEIWLATESGIFILNEKTNQITNLKKKFLDPFSLSDNAVYSLCKDNEGGIWVGTYFGGINYYSPKYSLFEKYYPDNSKKSISGNAVREICEDHFGNIWIGTEDFGLNKLNPKTGEITQFVPTGESGSIAYSNIHGLLAVGNDLWIGTFEHGLDIMDIRTGKIKKHYNSGLGKYDLKSNFIVSFCQTKSGEIYVGSAYDLCRYIPEIDGFESIKEVPKQIWVSSILEDFNKTIWIGTHNGVFYFNPITKEKGHLLNNPKDKNTITNNDINAIYEDSKQCLWFSTEGGGLCKLSKDRKIITSFTTQNGLPSNFVFKALEDDKRRMWITTSKGLVNFNPENNNVIIYTKNNGLLSDQFNYNSGYKDKSGRMYFGSVKGMITFNSKDILKKSIIPKIYLTDFQIDNKKQTIGKENSILKKSITFTDEITLPYDKSSFSIDFTALSFTSPEMTVFSYFMDGLDKEWTEIKPNRKVYFTNLSSGKYIFKLRAFVNGSWTKKDKQLIVNIFPPWWATWWAYLFYTVVVLSLIYYLFASYHTIVQDRKEKEIYEAKIDFFTNLAHEIRTPLTLIKGPIENLLEQIDEVPQIKEDVVLMDRNTNRLIALVTQILDFRKVESKSFSLDFTNVNVTQLLKDSFANFKSLTQKRKLEYTISFPQNDVFAFADEEALNKIFSNLLNNAVKFASQKVAVRMFPISQKSTYLTIEFENDGLKIPLEKKEKIFEPFYRLKESKQQGTGIGLSLARSLTELLNGDLYLKDTSDSSIVFVLTLPIFPPKGNNE